MAEIPLNRTTLYKQQQIGEGTDCCFVFKTETEDGKSTESVIHGHKFVLSAVSPYFEAAFKKEWKGNDPIPITTFEYEAFQKLMKAIYLMDISFNNLSEALELYVVAHFYQVKVVMNMLRDKILKFCYDKKPLNISELVNIALKYQDFKLMHFASKYFSCIAHKIINSAEFLQYSFDSINFLYQNDDLSADEHKLLSALEKVVQKRGPDSIEGLKPAIDAIRFSAMPRRISGTKLLSQEEKNFLQGKNHANFTYLSKSKVARKRKTFFSFLSPETQYQLQEKFSLEKCWLCREYHNIFDCQKARAKYAIYRDRDLKDRIKEDGLDSMFKNEIIDLAENLADDFYLDPNLDYFLDIRKELRQIFYID